MITSALLVLVTGCSPLAATSNLPPTPQVKTPEEVLRAITDALNANNADAAAAYLAEDATQTLIPAPSGTGVYTGKEAMRKRFQEVVAANPTHKLTNCQTSGDTVSCTATYSDDSTRPLGFDLEFEVDAMVQNGLLKKVTWKMTDASLARMKAALANAQLPPVAIDYAPDMCTFSSPNKFYVGDIHVQLNVEGQDEANYGLFIATLDPGKTIDDLKGLPAVPQPDWVHEINMFEFSKTNTQVATIAKGPIYLLCFNLSGDWQIIGAFGPIEVVSIE